MLRLFVFFKRYISTVTELIFSGYFFRCLPYSLFLFVPDQVFSVFHKKRNRDAFVSLFSLFNKDFKVKFIDDYWFVKWQGVKFYLPHLTNELLEIGCDFVDDLNSKLLKTLNIPFIFEGSYLKKRQMIKPGDFVLDMGASLGIFSVFAALKVGPTGRILAFEPNDLVAEILRKNIVANGVDNVLIAKDVLTDQVGEIDFNIDVNGAQGSSSIFEIKSNNSFCIKAKQNTLDNFVLENKIERVDFIKADIEGAERLMLKGAEQTIRKFKPSIAIRIYHLPDDPEVIEAMLKDFVPEYRIEKFGHKTLYAYLES